MAVPDPNRFDGTVELLKPGETWQATPTTHDYADGNYRSIGLVDMAQALHEGRLHRASGEMALHVLKVMAGLVEAAETGGSITIDSRCERPAPLAPGLNVGEIA